jgi:acylphosphatase
LTEGRRAHVRISGSVQGVGFRYEARDRARSLGLGGFIRNLSDGTVEGAFEGPEQRVESMLDWCRRGPAGAQVEGVDVEWEEPHGEMGFWIA